MNFQPSVDIFCKVVDNFGDIGVCWRLARQLAVERGLITRLFVDDISVLYAIMPVPDPQVSVIAWGDGLDYGGAADVVIEAFACDLPPQVVRAMVQKKSVWIDLEYLSAEDWVAGCHAIPSKHPSTGLNKTLFFPGFDARTGGLIRENSLISRRDAFLSDKEAQNKWRKAHFIPEIDENCLDISFFHYKTAPTERFLQQLSALGKNVRVLRPVRNFDPRTSRRDPAIWDIPFVSQYDYDALLWTCDVNFVRGEDSFVRAQWAGKPFIWNIYVQDEAAHLVKLRAFLETIRPFYDAACFERLANFHNLWNEGGQNETKDHEELWRDGLQFLESLGGLGLGARTWSDYLLGQSDLATQLLAFAQSQITDN
jgi:uncharacterized repeat protein (TIGR03837 family)